MGKFRSAKVIGRCQSMQRYFIKEENWIGNTITIDGEDAKHIAVVMRMNIDDQIICVHPEQFAAKCTIVSIEKNEVIVEMIEELTQNSELPVQITIASGLPKGDKLEYVFQKGTELGAYEFIPVKMERSIVKWDQKKGKKKLERWHKITKEAAEQSHRHYIPQIQEPKTIQQLVDDSEDYTYKLVAFEEEANQLDKSEFTKVVSSLKKGDSLLIVFGPEGGLSPKEIKTLQAAHFKICGLGPRILRTETAPLYTLSAISYAVELN